MTDALQDVIDESQRMSRLVQGLLALARADAGQKLAREPVRLDELVRVSRGGVTVARSPESIADAILDLLSNPDRLRRLGENGRRFWQGECTVEAVSRWHERLYGSLLPRSEETVALVPSHA